MTKVIFELLTALAKLVLQRGERKNKENTAAMRPVRTGAASGRRTSGMKTLIKVLVAIAAVAGVLFAAKAVIERTAKVREDEKRRLVRLRARLNKAAERSGEAGIDNAADTIADYRDEDDDEEYVLPAEVEKAKETAKKTAKKAAEKVEEKAEEIADAAEEAVEETVEEIQELTEDTLEQLLGD